MLIRSSRTATLMLLLVSFIWGVEFVLIDLAIEDIPTHTFNAIRFLLAALSLTPLLWFNRHQLKGVRWWPLLGASALLGSLLFISFYTQTEGMHYTSVSNAGFITGLNVPLVPLLGFLLFRKRASPAVWAGVIIATTGLYLLTMGDKLEFNHGDLLVLVCAFGFAVHILLTGRFVDSLPVVPLSILQLLAVALYSTIGAVTSADPAFYHPGSPPLDWQDLAMNPTVIIAALVAGIMGTGYAYWAQSASQQVLESHKVALIFATEPVFAYLSAWFFLNEKLGTLGMIGAGLIIAAMLISELGDRKRKVKLEPLDQTTSVTD
ncbi:DMT family transporter [Amphritea pacifica]|uniref:DMT family transporter n=1 Tax=Amphritea pacifica TaxID=2811233 RepID=A0ABS2W6M3_9GAMM|nr:DMT family transporter [Amphritea pacifica]MBN0987255.1 DMT family transporter [Amphritea pacifica]MBN1005745.1 DMT family transporter [Amphritea pacifica]